MDNNYPENADLHPKRRKDKDNPYTIVGMIEKEFCRCILGILKTKT